MVALLSGGAVSVGLLLVDRGDADAHDFYVAAHDVPAGTRLSADLLRTERLQLGRAPSLAFGPEAKAALPGRRASPELRAGQLIQAADLAGPAAAPDRRLVWVPIKDLPPSGPGDRLDLLLLSGPPERTVVTPFAVDLLVHSAGNGGAVLAVPSRQAPAPLYAGAAGRLVAVTAAPGSAGGDEGSVTSLEQAAGLMRR